jgi:hypothetical protein
VIPIFSGSLHPEEMSLPSETEDTPDRRGGPEKTVGVASLRGILGDRRIIWLFLATAAIHSIIPAKLLLAPWNGGMVPGIAILLLMVFAIVWLVAVWCLAAAGALVRRKGVRAVILVLLVLPYPFELPLLFQMLTEVPHLLDDPKTGRGYFDGPTDRELGGAIWACDRRNQSDGAVCDLDKIRALTAKTDTSKVSSSGTSLMWWAISSGAEPDVLRIVLKGGKPPEDVSSWLLETACCDSSDLLLLRAALEGGVDPNTKKQDGNPYLFNTLQWPQGLAAYLDAGAQIDAPDREGYTALMRAITWHQYEAAELLITRGAARNKAAPDGTTSEMLLSAIPPEDAAKLPPALRAVRDSQPPHRNGG